MPKRKRNRKKYLDEYKELIKKLLNDEEREFLYIDIYICVSDFH